MRVSSFVLALSVLVAASAPAGAAARRVASLNLCTDELALTLAGPGQLVSVTHLAHDARETPLAARGGTIGANDGTLLSVAPLAPDLVLTMGTGGRDSARLATRIGARLIDLPMPSDIPALAANIRIVATALERPAAADALLGRLSAMRPPAGPAIDAVFLTGSGGGPGPMASALLAAAGIRVRPAPAGLEQLIADPPAILIRSDYRARQTSAVARWLRHPAFRRLDATTRTIVTDGRVWTCAGPAAIAEAARLGRLARQ